VDCRMRAKVQLPLVFLSILAFAGVLFASKFTSISLNNIIIGGQWSQRASVRFMAKTNAPLSAVRLYWIIANPAGHAGYASGTGGQIAYSLRTDSNGQPGRVLATASMIQNQVTENQRGNFPLICFPPASLISGQYYDIVVENGDPNSYANWSSVDFLWDPIAKNQTPDIQVWVSVEGGAFAPGDGGTFIGTPVALFYADGTIQGHGDIAIGSAYPGGFECGSGYGFPATLCQ
jgi:hypothetical protein